MCFQMERDACARLSLTLQEWPFKDIFVSLRVVDIGFNFLMLGNEESYPLIPSVPPQHMQS